MPARCALFARNLREMPARYAAFARNLRAFDGAAVPLTPRKCSVSSTVAPSRCSSRYLSRAKKAFYVDKCGRGHIVMSLLPHFCFLNTESALESYCKNQPGRLTGLCQQFQVFRFKEQGFGEARGPAGDAVPDHLCGDGQSDLYVHLDEGPAACTDTVLVAYPSEILDAA